MDEEITEEYTQRIYSMIQKKRYSEKEKERERERERVCVCVCISVRKSMLGPRQTSNFCKQYCDIAIKQYCDKVIIF
jgi:hypothetical protein